MGQDTILANHVVNSEPFLTIGIANYNYGKYLRRGFEAIMRQSFRNIELIYADNGSTDNSQKIIKEFMEKADIPVSLVAGKNLGICGNRNRILKQAKGRYLMLCDADDWITDNCLEVLCKKAMETDADQVVGRYQKVDSGGKILYKHAFPERAVKWSNWGYHASLYKMQVIKENNIQFDLSWPADDACFSALFHKYSGETVFVDEIVENWYKHNDSVTSMYLAKEKKQATVYNSSARFESMTSYIFDIWKAVPEIDRKQLEYVWSIMYYYNILYRRPAARFEEDREGYKELHQAMIRYFPDYLSNEALRKFDGKGYFRKKVTVAACFLAFLERNHLITLALWGYWVLTHVYKIRY